MPAYVGVNKIKSLSGDHVREADLSEATPILVPESATLLMIQAENQNVRITFDGTTPTDSVGFLLVADGPPISFNVSPVMDIQVVETIFGAAVNYQCFEF